MSFQITDETVIMMKGLSTLLKSSIDGLHKDNNEVINCYKQVSSTVGPHSRQIEIIVREMEKLLKKYSEDIEAVSAGLLNLSNRCQIILTQKSFKNSLKVSITSRTVVCPSSITKPLDGAPTIGPRERQLAKQTEYEQ